MNKRKMRLTESFSTCKIVNRTFVLFLRLQIPMEIHSDDKKNQYKRHNFNEEFFLNEDA